MLVRLEAKVSRASRASSLPTMGVDSLKAPSPQIYSIYASFLPKIRGLYPCKGLGIRRCKYRSYNWIPESISSVYRIVWALLSIGLQRRTHCWADLSNLCPARSGT